MKFVGICGLHGAGKTYFATRINTLTGWPILDKRAVMKQLYHQQWLRRHEQESWEAWYRQVFDRYGPEIIMQRLIETAKLSAPIVILDAIHAPNEWKTVKIAAPDSILVGVWTPHALRVSRMDEPPEMDARRIQFWHNDNACLAAIVEWACPGNLADPLFESLCKEIIAYVSSLP